MKYLFFDSFEDIAVKEQPVKTTLWTSLNNTSGAFVTDEIDAFDGKKSLKMVSDGKMGGWGFRSKAIPVEAGKKYTVEVSCKLSEESSSGYPQVYAEFHDKEKRLAPVGIISYTDSEWETLTNTTRAPKGTEYMTVLLYAPSTMDFTAYFDNVKVYEFEGEDDGLTDEERYCDMKTENPIARKDFPRLYLTKSSKEDILEKIKDITPNYAGSSKKDAVDYIISNADKFEKETEFTVSYYGDHRVTFKYPLTQPEPMDNPPKFNSPARYPYWTGMSGQIRTRLQYLATAYMITGLDKYGDKATEMVLALSDWTSWSDPSYGTGNACLDSGYLTFGVCMVYDFLYYRFTEAQRNKIEDAIYRNGLVRPMRDWNIAVDHNIQVVLTCGIAFAACALHGKFKETNEAITKAMGYFKWYLDRRYNSNCHEGNMYTTLAMEYIMNAANAIRNTTGRADIFDHKFISEVLFKWMIMGGENTKGKFALISDGDHNVGFFITASILYKTTNNPYAGYYLKRSKVFPLSLEGLLYGADEIDTPTPSFDLQSIKLDKIGWGSMRTSWDEDGSLLVFTSSQSNLGHNHYDNNSFVLSRRGEWICDDPGYQDYSAGDNREYTTKYGHSTVYVDGLSQNMLGSSTISEKLTGNAFSLMTGSAAKAYKNPSLKVFDRSFISVNRKNAPYFIIKDDITASKEREFTWRLNITNAKAVKIGGSDAPLNTERKGLSLEAEYDKSRMLVSFASDKDLHIRYYQYLTTVGKLCDVSDGVRSEDKRYLSVIALGDKDGNSPLPYALSLIDEAGLYGCKVSVQGKEDMILFGNGDGISYDGISSDASFVSLLGMADGAFTDGFAATDVTELKYNGRTLLSSSAPLSFSLLYNEDGNGLDISEDCVIKLLLPENASSLKIYGEDGCTEKDKDGYVTLTLKKGKYYISIK